MRDRHGTAQLPAQPHAQQSMHSSQKASRQAFGGLTQRQQWPLVTPHTPQTEQLTKFLGSEQSGSLHQQEVWVRHMKRATIGMSKLDAAAGANQAPQDDRKGVQMSNSRGVEAVARSRRYDSYKCGEKDVKVDTNGPCNIAVVMANKHQSVGGNSKMHHKLER